MNTRRVPVLIVGGGVAGLTTSIFLSSRAARKQRVWTLKRVKPELAL